MKSFNHRESALALIFVLLAFCMVSNDDLQQTELAQDMAAAHGVVK